MLASSLGKNNPIDPHAHLPPAERAKIPARAQIAQAIQTAQSAVWVLGWAHQSLVRNSANRIITGTQSITNANQRMAASVGVTANPHGKFEVTHTLPRGELLRAVAASGTAAGHVAEHAQTIVGHWQGVMRHAVDTRKEAARILTSMRTYPWRQIGILPIAEIRGTHIPTARAAAHEFSPSEVDPFKPSALQIMRAIFGGLVGRREFR